MEKFAKQWGKPKNGGEGLIKVGGESLLSKDFIEIVAEDLVS